MDLMNTVTNTKKLSSNPDQAGLVSRAQSGDGQAFGTLKAREETMRNLRILIADDHDLMRRGLKALVESHPGWQVCDEAYTGREAVAKAEQMKPDIVILDISMPELNGLEAARSIRK